MLKVHRYSSTFTPSVLAGTRKQVMPRASPSLPQVRANSAQWVATCMPVVHIFWPLISHPEMPSRVAGTARVSMWVASEPCSGSVRPKVIRYLPLIEAVDHRLLLVVAVAVEHGDERQIADDRMFVLQIIVQAKSLGGKMLADHRHPEIGAVLAAVLFRDRKSQMPGLIGEILHPAQQRLPFLPRQPAIVEIGARPFAAMIEETDIVVSLLDRLDLARDELIELVEIGDQIGRQGKIQGGTPGCLFLFVGLIVDC